MCRGLNNTKSIAVTPGEPAGIGPDLLIKFVQAERSTPLVAFTDPEHLLVRARQLRVSIDIDDYQPGTRPTCAAGRLTVAPIPLPGRVQPGQPRVECAAAILEAIEAAVQCVREGEMDALLTGPVHKSVIAESGRQFSGHTEFLKDLSGAAEVVMLLVSGSLRVALATGHVALGEVPASLTRAALEARIRILAEGLETQFAVPNPRILVAGLNPHAGEDGHLGREEHTLIAPALEALRTQGLCIEGPLPADTLFSEPVRTRADAILAMYHDQGLAPFKALTFGEGVNVTLGLPFVRTSVDHGTALDLAGSGRIDPGSFKAAFELASTLGAPGRA